MRPLDLTKAPPRSPREELGALCMLARMIDIARAKLPGGDIGQYQIGRGVSGVILRHLGMGVEEFVECVGNAAAEEEIVTRVTGRKTDRENRALSLKMQRLTAADVPPDLRTEFDRFYGSDVPAGKRVFDILEEDDAKAFGN